MFIQQMQAFVCFIQLNISSSLPIEYFIPILQANFASTAEINWVLIKTDTKQAMYNGDVR